MVFPQGATALQIGFEPNVEALNAHPEPDVIVAIAAVVDDGSAPDAALDPATLEKVAVAARVLDRLNLPGGTIQTTLQGLRRIRLRDVRLEDGFYTAAVSEVEEIPAAEADPVIERILTTVVGVAAKVERIPNEVPRILRMNLSDPSRFADLTAALCHFNVADRDAVLQRLDVAERLGFVLERLEETWERVQAVEAELPSHSEGEERQEGTTAPAGDRRGQIRRRIQALQVELGELDPLEREATELLRRVELADLPTRVAVAARRELERLGRTGTGPGEAAEIRGYVETLLAIPWKKRAGTGALDLEAVQRALDEKHVGLDEVKTRILEILSVAKLRGTVVGLVPCIVGPPAVGKRSLAAAVARGLGRPLVRVTLGGRGESALAGMRRTRSGAQLGKLAGALREAGVRDPVILLEEVDEVGLGNVEGDPIEVLEEFLDPDSRESFVDRYLDLPLDFSEAIVVASAHDFLRVPRDLREHFIEIRIAGYTPEEKVEIARRRLVPSLAREHGFDPADVEVDDATLLFLTRA